MMKIDIHNHILPESWPNLKEVGTRPNDGSTGAMLFKNPKDRRNKGVLTWARLHRVPLSLQAGQSRAQYTAV